MASHQEHAETYIMRPGNAPSAEAKIFTEASVSEIFKACCEKGKPASIHPQFSVTQEERTFVSTEDLPRSIHGGCGHSFPKPRDKQNAHLQERMIRQGSSRQSKHQTRYCSSVDESVVGPSRRRGEMAGTEESILYESVCVQLGTLQM